MQHSSFKGRFVSYEESKELKTCEYGPRSESDEEDSFITIIPGVVFYLKPRIVEDKSVASCDNLGQCFKTFFPSFLRMIQASKLECLHQSLYCKTLWICNVQIP